MEAQYAMFENTSGNAIRERDALEQSRREDEQKKQLIREDSLYGQRERAREAQRQNMVKTLDKQMADIKNAHLGDKAAKQAERENVLRAQRNCLESEHAKSMHRKNEEM